MVVRLDDWATPMQVISTVVPVHIAVILYCGGRKLFSPIIRSGSPDSTEMTFWTNPCMSSLHKSGSVLFHNKAHLDTLLSESGDSTIGGSNSIPPISEIIHTLQEVIVNIWPIHHAASNLKTTVSKTLSLAQRLSYLIDVCPAAVCDEGRVATSI